VEELSTITYGIFGFLLVLVIPVLMLNIKRFRTEGS